MPKQRTLTIRMSENACIETEMILAEAIDRAQENLRWYRLNGESGSTAAQSCLEGLHNAREALNTLECARMLGREPQWREGERSTETPAPH